jgi:hypothetical protein
VSPVVAWHPHCSLYGPLSAQPQPGTPSLRVPFPGKAVHQAEGSDGLNRA